MGIKQKTELRGAIIYNNEPTKVNKKTDLDSILITNFVKNVELIPNNTCTFNNYSPFHKSHLRSLKGVDTMPKKSVHLV